MNGKTKLVTTGVSLGFIITFAIGYGQVKGNVKHNKEEIKEVKIDVAKNTGDIDIEENTNLEQSIYIEQMQKNQVQIQQNQLKFVEEFRKLQQAQ